jgi:hypothetical protein
MLLLVMKELANCLAKQTCTFNEASTITYPALVLLVLSKQLSHVNLISFFSLTACLYSAWVMFVCIRQVHCSQWSHWIPCLRLLTSTLQVTHGFNLSWRIAAFLSGLCMFTVCVQLTCIESFYTYTSSQNPKLEDLQDNNAHNNSFMYWIIS